MPRSVLSALFSVVVVAGSLVAAEPPKVSGTAKDFELPNLAGGETKLSKLTAKGPVVLIVLRGYPGYQCPICTVQVGEFIRKAADFKKTGAQVVFVYPGQGDGLKEHAEEFAMNKSIPDHFTFLLDPDFTFTNSYGLRWKAKNETAYPSTFIIDGERKVKFARISRTHGDRASAADVLKALDKMNDK